MLLALLGLAYEAGRLDQKVRGLEEAVSTRGRVQISIEASNRLTALESADDRQDMRLTEIERQLRNLE